MKKLHCWLKVFKRLYKLFYVKNIKNEDENEENSVSSVDVEERLDKIDTLIKNNSKIKFEFRELVKC